MAYPALEVRDLQVVLALASTASTGAAAPVLHLSQSAVSRALGLAESKLGVRLFTRTPGGLVPTAEGERLIAAAGPLLARFLELEQAVRAPVKPPVRLRLVCECYTAYRWLPSALERLRGQLPDLEITLAVEHTKDPVAALQAGEIDLALLTTSPAPAGTRESPLFSDEVVFVVSPAHPLARRAAVGPADLEKTTLVCANSPAAEQQWFLRSVFGRRRPRLSWLRLPLTEAIADAARAGLGVAILSEWIASGYLGGKDLVARPFAPRPLLRPWRMAFRPEVAETAQRLSAALAGAPPRVRLR